MTRIFMGFCTAFAVGGFRGSGVTIITIITIIAIITIIKAFTLCVGV